MAKFRQERIDYASDLILRNPNVSKRGLQSAVKSEFGIGLSDTTRRSLLQKANTPAVLRARLNTPAFTRYERRVLRKVIHRSSNASYVVKAINERFTRAKDARDAGLTKQEFLRQMRREAKEQGYLATETTRTKDKPDGTVRGQIDWLKLLRDSRDRDIDRGEYIPKPRQKPRTDRGDLRAQKARYQDKQSTKAHGRWVERERSRLQTWISQKDSAIAVSSGARRQQLEQERANLERTLRSIR